MADPRSPRRVQVAGPSSGAAAACGSRSSTTAKSGSGRARRQAFKKLSPDSSKSGCGGDVPFVLKRSISSSLPATGRIGLGALPPSPRGARLAAVDDRTLQRPRRWSTLTAGLDARASSRPDGLSCHEGDARRSVATVQSIPHALGQRSTPGRRLPPHSTRSCPQGRACLYERRR